MKIYIVECLIVFMEFPGTIILVVFLAVRKKNSDAMDNVQY